VSGGPLDGRGGEQREGGPQNIATAITDVTERFSVLIHDEIELAKAEVAEKTAKLARGAVVAVAAGVFLVTALFFVLIGLAWLLYYELPIGNDFTYFWGFFAMALILIVLGAIAGLIAAKVVKRGAPPIPSMAIEEARKIRESVSSSAAAEATAAAREAAAEATAAAREAAAEATAAAREAAAGATAAAREAAAGTQGVGAQSPPVAAGAAGKGA
jgi:uncharacterized membrane protein YqjE